jgi:hypothetical protein
MTRTYETSSLLSRGGLKAMKYIPVAILALLANVQILAYLNLADKISQERLNNASSEYGRVPDIDRVCDCYVGPHFSVMGPRPTDRSYKWDYDLSRDQAQPVGRNVLEILGVPIHDTYVVRIGGKYIMEETHWRNYFENSI